MPKRGAIFTGRYPSVTGARHNGLPLPGNASTFVDLLANAGYHTACIGKSHLQPFTDRDVKAEGRETEVNPRFPEALVAVSQDYLAEHPATYDASSSYEIPSPYYSFDHLRLVTNHSDECGAHNL